MSSRKKEDSVKVVKFVDVPLKTIGEEEIVKVKTVKNKIEMTKMDRQSSKITQYKKIKGDKYVKTLKNGRKTKPRKNKNDKYKFRSISAIKKSFQKLNDLIVLNFQGNPLNEFHIVLKYNKPKMSISKVYPDITALNKSLSKIVKNTKIIYIAKPELHSQKLGWHIHLIVRFESESNYTIKDIELIFDKAWKHGLLNITEVYDAEGLAVYLTYLKKPTEEYLDYKDRLIKGLIPADKKFKICKNYENSLYYPKGCKLYVQSLGLKKPAIDRVEKKVHDSMVKGKKMVSAESKDIVNSYGIVINGYTKIKHQ